MPRNNTNGHAVQPLISSYITHEMLYCIPPLPPLYLEEEVTGQPDQNSKGNTSHQIAGGHNSSSKYLLNSYDGYTDLSVKLFLVGGPSTGKTSFINRFIRGLSPQPSVTINVEVSSKEWECAMPLYLPKYVPPYMFQELGQFLNRPPSPVVFYNSNDGALGGTAVTTDSLTPPRSNSNADPVNIDNNLVGSTSSYVPDTVCKPNTNLDISAVSNGSRDDLFSSCQSAPLGTQVVSYSNIFHKGAFDSTPSHIKVIQRARDETKVTRTQFKSRIQKMQQVPFPPQSDVTNTDNSNSEKPTKSSPDAEKPPISVPCTCVERSLATPPTIFVNSSGSDGIVLESAISIAPKGGIKAAKLLLERSRELSKKGVPLQNSLGSTAPLCGQGGGPSLSLLTSSNIHPNVPSGPAKAGIVAENSNFAVIAEDMIVRPPNVVSSYSTAYDAPGTYQTGRSNVSDTGSSFRGLWGPQGSQCSTVECYTLLQQEVRHTTLSTVTKSQKATHPKHFAYLPPSCAAKQINSISNSNTTISYGFYQSRPITMKFFDIQGQERAFHGTQAFYRHAMCALVFIDVYSPRSIQEALAWKEDIDKHAWVTRAPPPTPPSTASGAGWDTTPTRNTRHRHNVMYNRAAPRHASARPAMTANQCSGDGAVGDVTTVPLPAWLVIHKCDLLVRSADTASPSVTQGHENIGADVAQETPALMFPPSSREYWEELLTQCPPNYDVDSFCSKYGFVGWSFASSKTDTNVNGVVDAVLSYVCDNHPNEVVDCSNKMSQGITMKIPRGNVGRHKAENKCMC